MTTKTIIRASFLALWLFILVACTTKNAQSLEEYFNNSSIQLRSQVVPVDSLFIGQVWDIEGFDNSLILLDEHQNKYFSLIDLKSNKLVKRFGEKGKGPQELLEPVCITVDKAKNTFQMLLRNPERFVEYSIDELRQNPHPVYKEKVRFDFMEESLFNIAPLYGSNRYIGTGLFHTGKYGITNKVGVLDTVIGKIQRPDDQMNIDNYKIGMVYQGITKSHPTQKKFVHVSTSCDLIEIVDETDYKSKSFQSYFPKLKMQNGTVSETRDSRVGFIALKVTSNYIYTVFSGRTINKEGGKAFLGNKLYVFKWNMKPVCSYVLDHDINCLFVSEDDKTMYSVAMVEDDMQLVKWEIEI